MAGFYRSGYTTVEGESRVMASTQFEALDARRCFPCWDEPARKAIFQVRKNVTFTLSTCVDYRTVVVHAVLSRTERVNPFENWFRDQSRLRKGEMLGDRLGHHFGVPKKINMLECSWGGGGGESERMSNKHIFLKAFFVLGFVLGDACGAKGSHGV